jgi:hypothetical protein
VNAFQTFSYYHDVFNDRISQNSHIPKRRLYSMRKLKDLLVNIDVYLLVLNIGELFLFLWGNSMFSIFPLTSIFCVVLIKVSSMNLPFVRSLSSGSLEIDRTSDQFFFFNEMRATFRVSSLLSLAMTLSLL